jgi:prepilin-type N-terminal cleavage/methylation domain-containing protein
MNKLFKRNKSEHAFTIVEMLISISIIAVLTALAIPAFWAAQQAAIKASVQSDVANTVSSMEAYLVENSFTNSFPESILVVSKNNAVEISGTSENYAVCGYHTGSFEYSYGWSSLTRQYSENCYTYPNDENNDENNESEVGSPPPAPTGFVLVSNENSIESSWEPSPGATSYKVYKDGQFVAETTDPNYTFTDLDPNEPVEITVEAVNNVGTSPRVVKETSTTSDTPAILELEVNPTTVIATWNASFGADYYNLYIDGIVFGIATTELTFTFEDLTPSTTYVFGVSAVNEFGESSITTATAITGIEQPTNLNVVMSLSTNISAATFSWNEVESAEKYNVFLNGQKLGETTSTSWTETLVCGTKYTFGVNAVNDINISATSTLVYWAKACLSQPTEPYRISSTQYRSVFDIGRSNANLIVTYTSSTSPTQTTSVRVAPNGSVTVLSNSGTGGITSGTTTVNGQQVVRITFTHNYTKGSSTRYTATVSYETVLGGTNRISRNTPLWF